MPHFPYLSEILIYFLWIFPSNRLSSQGFPGSSLYHPGWFYNDQVWKGNMLRQYSLDRSNEGKNQLLAGGLGSWRRKGTKRKNSLWGLKPKQPPGQLLVSWSEARNDCGPVLTPQAGLPFLAALLFSPALLCRFFPPQPEGLPYRTLEHPYHHFFT